MAGDPLEAMTNVVLHEASRLQSLLDSDTLCDALAVSEAELQRSRLPDRLEAAIGLAVSLHLPGEHLSGCVRAVGAEIVIIESQHQLMALALGSLVSIDGLPKALRAEPDCLPRVRITWSSVLREWAELGLIHLVLSDGRCVIAWVDSVGGDHLDLRDCDGKALVVMLSAIRRATISR